MLNAEGKWQSWRSRSPRSWAPLTEKSLWNNMGFKSAQCGAPLVEKHWTAVVALDGEMYPARPKNQTIKAFKQSQAFNTRLFWRPAEMWAVGKELRSRRWLKKDFYLSSALAKILGFFSVLEKLFSDPVISNTASVESRLQNHPERGLLAMKNGKPILSV